MATKSSTDAPAVQRIGAHSYLVSSAGGALVTFAALPDTATLDVGKATNVRVPNSDQTVEVMYWGASNDLPFYREELITGNNIVPALIERKRNILCGQGWYAYRERFVDTPDGMMKGVVDEVPMPDEAAAFFKKYKKTARRLVGELLKHGIALPEFVRDKGGRIISVKSQEVKYCRPAKKDMQGEIRTWYWSNTWQRHVYLKQDEKRVTPMPVYDETAAPRQPRFVLPLLDDLFNDGYFPVPSYWGGRHWMSLSNIIPLFHEANLKHGQMPRWNVVIPHDYFYDYEAMTNATTEPERAALLTEFQAREQQFIDDFNQVMTGIGNTGRTVTTKSELVDAIGGKHEKRILIEPLNVDMKDEALLALFAASNVANISAQALHPSLASVETQGKLSSGTEIRNAFILYLIIAAPVYRDLLMEVVDLVKQENGWPADIHYAIRDAEMTTLAENPAGVREAETQIGAQ